MRLQNIAHATIETLNHAVGLWPIGRNQPMIDAMPCTESIHPMLPGGLSLASGNEAVGEGLAIIRQQRLDPERCSLVDVL